MKGLSTLSFDVDSWRTTLEAHGLKGDPADDFIIREGLPGILDFLLRERVKCTFFVIGREVVRYPDEHRRIVEEGHEAANHTFSHHPSFGLLPEDEKRKEILEADRAITEILARPTGFRAPGYQVDEETLNILSETGYLYDSSVVPYSLFCRAFLRLRRQVRPDPSRLIELPISSSALLKIPINGTTIINLGFEWFRLNCRLLLRSGLPLNINFHARDGVGSLPREKGLPAYLFRGKKKSMEVLKRVLSFLQENTTILTCMRLAGRMGEWTL